MSSPAGRVLLEVSANLDTLKRDVERAMGDAGKAGANKFASALDGAQRRLSRAGASLTKSVTLPIVAVGTAAVAAASSVDDALREIRVGTGATGETLADLEKDFQAVGKTSSVSLERVGSIIADLNTRLGLSGEPLQALAGQVADLEQILGGVPVNLDTLTRVFGAFQVGPEQYGESLDRLFRASQATGVGFDQLQNLVVSQSAAFGELGFNLDETTAIIGQFEKAGVNTGTVIAALRANIVRAAASGQSAGDFFRGAVGEIEGFIAAGDEAAAQSAARELFGARTFLDALDAIKRGQFDITGTLDAIQNGEDTISGLAEETKTFSQQFAEFRNNLTLSLAPLGQKLFPILTNAVEQLLPPLIAILDRFANLDPTLQTVIVAVAGAAAALGPVLSIAAKLIPVIKGIGLAFTFLAANPIVLVLAGIAAAAFLIIKNWEPISRFFKGVFDAVGRAMSAFVGWVRQYIIDPLAGVINWLTSNWDIVLALVTGPFGIAVLVIRRFGDDILGVFKNLFRSIGRFFKAGWDGAVRITRSAVEGIIRVVQVVLDIPGRIGRAIADVARTVVAGVKGIINGFAGAINAVIRFINRIEVPIPNWIPIVGGNTLGFPNVPEIPQLAQGGPLRANQLALVGELGPELFVPNRSGSVVSNAELASLLGSAEPSSINITVNNPVEEPTSVTVARERRRAGFYVGAFT